MSQPRSLFVAAALVAGALGAARCGSPPPPASSTSNDSAIERDLVDVTVDQLQRYYRDRKYTVTQVTAWHLDRIGRYNGIYRAIEQVFRDEALKRAAELDAEPAGGAQRGPLWGVPIVIKANTSIKDQVTTDGWEGFTIKGPSSSRRATPASSPSSVPPAR